jgi:hypothetical protein
MKLDYAHPTHGPRIPVRSVLASTFALIVVLVGFLASLLSTLGCVIYKNWGGLIPAGAIAISTGVAIYALIADLVRQRR